MSKLVRTFALRLDTCSCQCLSYHLADALRPCETRVWSEETKENAPTGNRRSVPAQVNGNGLANVVRERQLAYLRTLAAYG